MVYNFHGVRNSVEANSQIKFNNLQLRNRTLSCEDVHNKIIKSKPNATFCYVNSLVKMKNAQLLAYYHSYSFNVTLITFTSATQS